METHRTGQCAGCLHARQCAGCRRWGWKTYLSVCQAVRWVQKVGLGDPLVCMPGSALGAEGGAWRLTGLHARPCAGCRRWGLETHWSACQALRWVQKVGLEDPHDQPVCRMAGIAALVQSGWRCSPFTVWLAMQPLLDLRLEVWPLLEMWLAKRPLLEMRLAKWPLLIVAGDAALAQCVPVEGRVWQWLTPACGGGQGVREVEEWMSRSSGIPLEELRPYMFLFRDKDASGHLLRRAPLQPPHSGRVDTDYTMRCACSRGSVHRCACQSFSRMRC